MKKVFARPRSLKPVPFRYCTGCGHSIVQRLIAESTDELGIRDKVIGIAPVGCAIFAYEYFNFDMIEVAHGRPPAVATALKRVMPDRAIFSYQGDGDLAAIGTSEIIHAATRGENFSVFFINNATYGMTGGQMAPTTILGQRTSTTVRGRDAASTGYPLRVSELLATIEGTSFIQRVSVDSFKNILITKKAIKKSLNDQLEGKGFSFIEILSACPTDWGLSPKESLEWLSSKMTRVYPLGIIKDKSKRGI
jgi:2-oxoglutarate ferredoxin oxidoreductase subunit beta